MTPLTVSEARTILAVDEVLRRAVPLFETEVLAADAHEVWIKLVESAADRVASFGGTPRIASSLSSISAGPRQTCRACHEAALSPGDRCRACGRSGG